MWKKHQGSSRKWLQGCNRQHSFKKALSWCKELSLQSRCPEYKQKSGCESKHSSSLPASTSCSASRVTLEQQLLPSPLCRACPGQFCRQIQLLVVFRQPRGKSKNSWHKQGCYNGRCNNIVKKFTYLHKTFTKVITVGNQWCSTSEIKHNRLTMAQLSVLKIFTTENQIQLWP